MHTSEEKVVYLMEYIYHVQIWNVFIPGACALVSGETVDDLEGDVTIIAVVVVSSMWAGHADKRIVKNGGKRVGEILQRIGNRQHRQ